MDLSLMNTADTSEDGAWLEVLDFDWETPVGCSILVMGPDSKDAMKISDEEEKYNQKRLAEAFAGSKKGKLEPEEEASVDKLVRKAVKLTKGWKDIEWNKEAFPYNDTNAYTLYSKIPHIRTQVLNFYRDRANFTKPEYASWRKQFGADSTSTSPDKAASASEKRSSK